MCSVNRYLPEVETILSIVSGSWNACDGLGQSIDCLCHLSESLNQIARAHSNSLGNPQKRMKADPLLAAFDLADVNRVEVRLFSQLLLTQARLHSVLTNGISENSELWRLARHSLSSEQKGQNANTPNMGVSSTWLPSGVRVEFTE